MPLVFFFGCSDPLLELAARTSIEGTFSTGSPDMVYRAPREMGPLMRGKTWQGEKENPNARVLRGHNAVEGFTKLKSHKPCSHVFVGPGPIPSYKAPMNILYDISVSNSPGPRPNDHKPPDQRGGSSGRRLRKPNGSELVQVQRPSALAPTDDVASNRVDIREDARAN